MTQLEDGHLDASELYLAACEGASPARLAELAAWSPYVVQAAVGRAVRCAELQGAARRPGGPPALGRGDVHAPPAHPGAAQAAAPVALTDRQASAGSTSRGERGR